MSELQEVLADCETHGIQLIPAGDAGLTIDAPEGALTSDLIERLKTHKAELLTLLLPAADNDADGWDDAIEPPVPCPKCGRLELWQSVAGDSLGQTPGTWRCVRCDPPTTARRLRDTAARLRKQAPRMARSGPKTRDSTTNTYGDSRRQTGP